MIEVTPTRNWRDFTRARLRDAIGPSNPLYHPLESQMFQDVYWFIDDEFTGVLSTAAWTVANNGAGAADFARVANIPGGAINGDAGTADDGDARLFTTSNELVTANRRPVLYGRIGQNSAVASSKFEFGFADAAGAGAVLVKATPTSTATDYAVIIRDTDHNTSVDLVTDGGTDAVGLVASSPGQPSAWATQTWYSLVISLDEVRGTRFYIDGIFQGIRRAGPDATVTLGAWLYIQGRDSAANRTLRADYIRGYAERVPFSGNAFTT